MMQFQADLLNTAVDRPKNIESTALGAAFLAGLHCGFWKDRAALAQCRTSERIFTPAMPQEERARRMMLWNRAIARAENWIE
jgi:glycerol kinase